MGGGLIAALPGCVQAEAAEWHGSPLVHSRRAWRARRPRRRARVLAGRPDHIVVHHTATPNSNDLSLGHAFELSRGIQRFHMAARGWDDIGEQLTISRGGHVMEGRNRSLAAILTGRHVVGAQTLHHNSHTIGIENEGTYMRAQVPPALWSSLVEVCAWLCRRYGLDPAVAIVGHRDYNATDCPGDVLYARLPELRRRTARLLGRPIETGPPHLPSAPPVVPPAGPDPGVGDAVDPGDAGDTGDADDYDSGPV